MSASASHHDRRRGTDVPVVAVGRAVGPAPARVAPVALARATPFCLALVMPFCLALVMLASLTGCSSMRLLHRGDPLTRVQARAAAHAETPKKSDLESMLDDAREKSALAPKEAYGPYRMAQVYAAADSTAKAEASLRVALEREPGYAPGYALMSKLYYASGRHREAIEMLEAARALPGPFPNGFPPELLAGLALHYEALERPDLARQLLAGASRSEASAMGPALVYLSLRSPGPDSVADLARSTMKHDSKSAANQNNYGISKLRSGDPDAARDAFREAIQLDPRLPGPYYNLAILEKYYSLDDDAAGKWFAQYWERSHDDPDGLADLFRKGEAKELATRKSGD